MSMRIQVTREGEGKRGEHRVKVPDDIESESPKRCLELHLRLEMGC